MIVLDPADSVQYWFDVPATPVPVSAAELRAVVEQRIRVGGRAESRSDEWEWTAFTHEGRKVGSVLLPAGFVVPAVRQDRLFGVFTDELDVPHIRMYRLVR